MIFWPLFGSLCIPILRPISYPQLMIDRLVEFGKEKRNIKKIIKIKKKIKIEGRGGAADILKYEVAHVRENKNKNMKKERESKSPLVDSVSAEYLHNR